MAEHEPTDREVYELILSDLSSRHAESLVREIESTVARGVASSGPESESSEQSKVFRPTQDHEALAVLVEFLVTALEVPLMMNEARRVFPCDTIQWYPERPEIDGEPAAYEDPGQLEMESLRTALSTLIGIVEELEITLPEIA